MSLYAGTTNVDKYHFQVTFPQPPLPGLSILGRSLLPIFPLTIHPTNRLSVHFPPTKQSHELSVTRSSRSSRSRRGCGLTSDVRQDAISRSPLLRLRYMSFLSRAASAKDSAKGKSWYILNWKSLGCSSNLFLYLPCPNANDERPRHAQNFFYYPGLCSRFNVCLETFVYSDWLPRHSLASVFLSFVPHWLSRKRIIAQSPEPSN